MEIPNYLYGINNKTFSKMKITIELSDEEVRGLKDYLKEADEPQTKESIKRHIENIVSGNLHAPQEAVSQYIAKYETT